MTPHPKQGGDTKPPPVASSSKLVDPLPTSLPSTSQLKAKASRPMLKQEGGELKPLVPVEKPKPKATGKLDWGKAKLKEPKIEKQIKSESVKSSTNCSNMGDVNDPKAAGSKLDKDVVGDETKARDGDVNVCHRPSIRERRAEYIPLAWNQKEIGRL